jgi:AcrR family transcriptional regulator
MSDPAGRKERRIAQRKEQIMTGAVKVFAEKGFHRATTKDIALAADVAEGTIYNYFQTKEAILWEIISQVAQLSQRQQVLEASVEQDPAQFFITHFVERLHTIAPAYEMILAVLPEILASAELRKQYNTMLIQPAIQMVESHLQARVGQGQLVMRDMALSARILVGMIFGLQLLYLIGDEMVQTNWHQPQHLAEELAQVLMNGIGTKTD